MSSDFSDEHIARNPYKAWYMPWTSRPHFIDQRNEVHRHPLVEGHFLSPLLFTLEQSEVRDHCANERTFLAWLRLAVYMNLFGLAIVLNFHIKSRPTHAEKLISLPLGIVFWLLSAGCLVNGVALYYRTAEKYGKRTALVQSGWKTQAMIVIVATAIIATCVYFVILNVRSDS